MATSPNKTASATGKKQVARAPQKRTFHFFVRITDANGTVIPGAKLAVDRIMTDARKVVEFLDTPEYASSGLTRVKHEIIANSRGVETDGPTSVG